MSIVVATQDELDAAAKADAEDIIIDSPAGVWLRVGGDTRIAGVRGASCVGPVGGSATVSGVRGSATVSGVWGLATVHLYGGATAQRIGSHVAVHLHSGAVKVTGGIIIDHTGVSDFEGAQWAAYHALADADGHAVVYKAVSPELEAGQSHRLTAYPIGETVAAPDWDPRKACGGGLHFSPTPRQALRYYQGPDSTKARYLACRVVLDTLVPLDDKCKAPSCEVLHEVTIDGEAVTA